MVLQESMGIRADLLRNLPKKDYVPNGYHSLMMIQGASMSPLFLLDTFDHFLNFLYIHPQKLQLSICHQY